MGSDKEVETEPFDGSNKHDQATQKLENEGQPLCHNAGFQKTSFSMIHVGAMCMIKHVTVVLNFPT